MNAPPTPRIRAVIEALREAGVTHVIGLPDNISAPLFHALRDDTRLGLVEVTREGEAFALGSGLWMGGAFPLVVIQNTGLLESGDALRGTAIRMGAPLPLVVTARGYGGMRSAGLHPGVPLTAEILTDPVVDSVALMTQPTLDAWGVPWVVCGAEDDPVVALGRLVADARARYRPTALILDRSLE